VVYPQTLNDITIGDNGAYRAGTGWDACTGLGSPDGTKLLDGLRKGSTGPAVTTVSVNGYAGASFESFTDFIHRTQGSRIEDHTRIGARVANDSAFGEMKAHIRGLYDGIEVDHSFVGLDGQLVDCVPIDQQPSLRFGPAAGFAVASPPVITPLPAPSVAETSGPANGLQPHLIAGQHDAFGNEQCCPAGTIPMRRVTLEDMTRFPTLEDFFRKAPLVKGHPRFTALDTVPHRYAHAYQLVNNFGGSSWLNLWSPIPTAHNFSLSQHWYSGGSGSGLQTVEAGWQVYPDHYNNSPNAVLFIYWTADAYNQTGNYNLDKPAFVQTNSSWVLGGGWGTYSVRDGDQREFRVHWQRDKSNGNWWLFLQGAGDLTPIGYYPHALFGAGQMANFATAIDYGGEVTGVTSGQMGSGALASDGFRRAAYQRSIFYTLTSGAGAWANLNGDAAYPNCYSMDLHNTTPGDWATYFFFGGPTCS
jgi:hypothetical protein